MKFNLALNNFTSGEWSPKMIARTDAQQYPRACVLLKNYIPLVQGGAFMRPGTFNMSLPEVTYNSETINTQDILDAAGSARCFAFTLSDGSKNFLFYTNGTPDGSAPWFVITNVTANGATRVRSVEATTGANYATTANLDTIEVKQFGDLIWIVDGENPPRIMSIRTDGTYRVDLKLFYEQAYAGSEWNAFPFTDLVSLGSGPTLTVTGTFTVGGSVTVVASSAFFNATMDDGANFGKGTLFRITKSGNTGVFEVTGYTSTTQVTGTVRAELPGSSGDVYGLASGTAWDMAMWGGGQGWPRTITGFQGRVYYGGSSRYPDTFWASRIGNVFQMMELPFAQADNFTTYADDNSRPWQKVVNSEQVSEIVTMSSSKMLAILTRNAEIVAYGSNGALGPNDFAFESSTYFGAEKVQACRVGNFLTFIQKGGKMRDLIFSFDEYQYKSSDLAFVADHLSTPAKMISAEFSSSIVFVKTQDGGLNTLTLDRDYQIVAWARQEFGGGHEDATIEVLDIAVSDKTEVYFLIKRTYDGDSRVSLEKLSPFYFGDSVVRTYAVDSNTRSEPPYAYMDCVTSYNRVALGFIPSDTIDGVNADIYGGRTVHVFGVSYTDASTTGWVYLGEFDVEDDGTLSDPSFENYQSFAYGFLYTARLEPVPIEAGSQYGSAAPAKKRAHNLVVRLYNTLGFKYGDLRDLYEESFVTDATPLGTAPDLFSGVRVVAMPGGYGEDYRLAFESSGPVPCNILSVAVEGQAHE